jgi:phosphate butyryltransferase
MACPHNFISSSDEIISSAAKLSESGKRKMVAVAAAQDVDVIGALSSAEAEGILDATLFGDKKLIEKMAGDGHIDISRMAIVDEKDVNKAAYAAVKMAAEGKADVIMKGFVSTSTLLKTVLAKDFNLRTRNTLSHVAVLDIPGYGKLLSMTDGGMVVKPDLEQKLQIMENAVLISRALRLNHIRVAVSGVNDNDTKAFFDRARELRMPDLELKGPLTFDRAAGRGVDADILISASIEECNIIAKALINFAGAVFAGVIVGARVPVSLVSRTDTVKNKKASVSLACLIADYYQKSGYGGSQ